MLITTAGVVIRERQIGENDKFVDILTEKNGVIEVSVKGVKKSTAQTLRQPSFIPIQTSA